LRHQLGKVTGAIDVPRGPDVIHRIRVPVDWLEEGALIQLDLPRNLTCAACEGGGCDKCDRSGAISVRGRKDAGEKVQVTLPRLDEASVETTASGRPLVIRIPERGGLSEDPQLRRGLLLLSIVTADEADAGVVRIERPEPEPVQEAAPAGSAPPPQPLAPSRPRSKAVTVTLVLVILWVVLLVWLRVTGRA
jgi:hypothetical protein